MGAMARCQETTSEKVHPEGEWCQENLKAPHCKDLANATLLQKSRNAIAASEDVVVEEHKLLSMEEELPDHVLSEIINRVEDARDLANCMATSKTLKKAVSQVRTLNLVCKRQYYELARKRYPIRPPCSYDSDSDSDSDSGADSDADSEEEPVPEPEPEEPEPETETDTETESEGESEDDDSEETEECCEMSKAMAMSMSSCGKHSPPHCRSSPVHISFKNACLNMLRRVETVEQLRIEVDTEMQANLLMKEEIHMVDFWLSEPMFVRRWISECSSSLKHLTLIDYGQQAIIRQSPIMRILSENCKQLQSLELRNMYLDTTDLSPLPNLQSLTLRCIKMTDYSLTDINTCMPGLVTLALVSVFGVQEARLASHNLEVLCLGLSTSAKVVDLNLPKVRKLQLKMTCPDSLHVRAPQLAYVAVCMENRENCVVEFESVSNLRELLFGASHFVTLSKLMRTNPLMEKMFVDVPCMALGEDGKWEGVFDQVAGLRVPDMAGLKESCPVLHTLSVGPGLWHSMELESSQSAPLQTRWPALSRLVVHMVVLSLNACVALLQRLVAAIPSLQVLEIYVHSDSPVSLDRLWSVCQAEISLHAKFQWGLWRKSLNFQCFSF